MWRYTPDVFLLIFLSDLDVASIWLQLMGGDLTEDLFVNGEEHLETALLDVIVPAGQKAIVITNIVKTTVLGTDQRAHTGSKLVLGFVIKDRNCQVKLNMMIIIITLKKQTNLEKKHNGMNEK